jgi:hypothetical protein
MIAKLFCGAAVLALACSPALAQMSMSKGQVTTIGTNGQATTGAMPTDAKMLKMMHSRGKPLGKSVTFWMDDSGHMMMCYCGSSGGNSGDR